MKPIPHSSCSNKTSKFCINFFGPALVLLLLTFISPVNSSTEQERHSLLQFLTGLSQDGGLAASWQNSTDCCTWEGIICGEDGAVTELLLALRGLQGCISSSLSELTSLSRLNLSYNLLSGELPSELIFSSIVVLDVSFNRLDGELQELNSSSPDRPLQVLNISSNLSPSFSVLDLSYNQFSGSMPPGIGKCSSLRMLRVGQNNIIGTLPDDLFRATSLEYSPFLTTTCKE
uniref:Leucine-rich repeat-containing N-terminal plant-type domain-containing protein n=1 Tax=Oryza meridionalis TaxID=40149 RepID=A0A0E0CFT2_9ORYZ